MSTGQTPPVHVAWDEAPARIVSIARERAATPVIGITGPVGAGKSTLARKVVEGLAAGVVLSTDWYLPDYERIPEHERDDPKHADLDELVSNLRALREGRACEAPIWSFHTHRREGRRRIEPVAGANGWGGVVVVEGIFALHERVAHALDVGVFVEASADVRWARWEILETSGVRGWGPEKARAFFENVADPEFHARASGYRARAHVVVRNDRGVPNADGSASV